MSVYTIISHAEAEDLLSNYNIGTIVMMNEIEGGVENTNYSVSTSTGSYIVTVIEHLNIEELEWCISFIHFLNKDKLAIAELCTTSDGKRISIFKGKPLLVWKKIKGEGIDFPSGQNITQVGEELAQLHNCGLKYGKERNNPRNHDWRKGALKKLKGNIHSSDYQLMAEEHEFQNIYEPKLPQGIIHGDLFRDNVLFHKDRLSGVIDFYYACTDSLLLDIAITINDWCVKEEEYYMLYVQFFISGYERHRYITNEEYDALPNMLRLAALRFWMSRTIDNCFPREGELVQTHDPLIMKNKLIIAKTATLDNLGI